MIVYSFGRQRRPSLFAIETMVGISSAGGLGDEVGVSVVRGDLRSRDLRSLRVGEALSKVGKDDWDGRDAGIEEDGCEEAVSGQKSC